MTVYEPKPRPRLSFGDVCSAEFLHDVHLRADGRALRREEMQLNAWWRKKLAIDAEEFPIWLAAAEPRADETYVLAHGHARDAVILSDDCVIETGLGRGQRAPSGRLLLAPITPADAEEFDRSAQELSLGRFPVDGDESHSQRYFVELRRVFMVDARDIAERAGSGLVTRSLSEETRGLLSMRWTAYVARRGPLIAQDNASKLASLLNADRDLSPEEAVSVARAVIGPSVAAWQFEGASLERAGAAWDARNQVERGDLTAQEAAPDLRDAATTGGELRNDLLALVEAANGALAALDSAGV